MRRVLATVLWDGGGGDLNWNNADNWSTGSLPGVADDVIIPDLSPDITINHTSGSTTINSLASAESISISGGAIDIQENSTIAANLTLGNSSSARLSGSGDITVGGTFDWSGGRLEGTGTLITAGDSNFSGSTKTIERSVENQGDVTWTSGSIQISSGGYTNLAGATFDAQTSASLTGSTSSDGFTNAGTFIRSSNSSTTNIFAPFDNSGALDVQLGAISFRSAA
ncbi:MAG: hypothetical protein AAGG48_29530, partial [Planctomycetota bacterium]